MVLCAAIVYGAVLFGSICTECCSVTGFEINDAVLPGTKTLPGGGVVGQSSSVSESLSLTAKSDLKYHDFI